MGKLDIPIRASDQEAMASILKAVAKKGLSFSDRQALMDQYNEIRTSSKLATSGMRKSAAILAREGADDYEYNKGGLTKKQKSKVATVMGEFKEKKLHSGKGGKVVKNPKQAIAIALSEAKAKKKK